MKQKNDIKICEYNKRYFSKKEMICVLKKRNLIIDKENILEKINYAHLIYNFGKYFQYKNLKCKNLKYKDGSKLSDIYNLYLFSKKGSIALFELIHDIEHKFKNILASLISKENAFDYLKKESYKFEKKENKSFNYFYKKIKKSHELFYLTKKEELKSKIKEEIIPIWIFIDRLSLRELINLVKYNKNLIKSSPYSKMKIKEKQMFIINKFRNEIAHMNPIEEKIQFKSNSKIDSIKFKDFLKILNILIPEFEKKLSKFWNKNENLLSKKIKKEIKNKFFVFN